MTWWLNLIGKVLASLKMSSEDHPSIEVTVQVPTEPQIQPVQAPLLWDTAKHAWHAVRVLCDDSGLTVERKNRLCACIYQESRFLNTAVGRNYGKDGTLLSTDWGIVQINDYYHIGVHNTSNGPVKLDFPSVGFVIDNPAKSVEWMISMEKHGLLKQWVSYSSGAYLVWLKPYSPVWLLKI